LLKEKAMKRNILLSIILLLITLGVTTGSGKIRPATTGIHYVVYVNNSLQNQATLCDLVVAITDGMGNIVAGPRQYMKGVSFYDLYENQPVVYGERIARMGVLPVGTLIPCPSAPAPSAQSGTFWSGQTYKYQLNLGPVSGPLSAPPTSVN
jgi:hypothetical protein